VMRMVGWAGLWFLGCGLEFWGLAGVGSGEHSCHAGEVVGGGLDLGDRSSFYCVQDEAGEVLPEQQVAMSGATTARSPILSPPD
jgi:hypothetical protein